MARTYEPTPKEFIEYTEWVATRPVVIREMAQRWNPWTLYRMKSTGHRVLICSFYEDRTLRVVVLAQYNLIGFERYVFGIDPDDLEECDLPGPDDPVGIAPVTILPPEATVH